MKTVQLVCVYPPYAGGIGTSAFNLSRYFSWDTITLNQGANQPADRVSYLSPLIRFGHAALPFSLFSKLKPYDLIYFHYPFFGAGLILFFFKLFHPRTRLIIQYHMDTGDLKGMKKILAWPERIISYRLFNLAEKIIVSSLDYAKNSEIKRYYQKHPDKFAAVPFAIDTQVFCPQENIQRADTQNIIFVGGLDKAHYFKGVDNLIIALSRSKLSKWQLTIAGTGELEKQYQELAKKLGVAEKVKFLGKLNNQEELIAAYRQNDVLALPSINSHEAFGIVLIEALACGLAVLASDLPGVRSVFNEAEGLKAIPNDIENLKEKLTEIFSDPQELLARKQAGRKLALEKYDTEKIKKQLREIIKEA